ncbi:hypothetical protein HDU76_000643 [Blyttiomyces sp. JEL0837]|nr:hypothetical protein HDU76_000643 [Blyttiomyces sp. JEL0837]
MGPDQTEIAFKIRRTTPMEKLIRAFTEKNGAGQGTYRFSYNGDRLNPHKTPDDLEMDDGDLIEATVEQLGGSCLQV